MPNARIRSNKYFVIDSIVNNGVNRLFHNPNTLSLNRKPMSVYRSYQGNGFIGLKNIRSIEDVIKN